MKFSIASSMSLLATLAVATPTPTHNYRSAEKRGTVEKRATISDSCDVGYASQNGGTTGGAGGTTTTVSSLADFTAAVTADEAMVVVVSGAITGADKLHITADTTIIGEEGSSLEGVGLYVKDVSNVIIRNMKISKVLAENGDAIGIQASTNVWVDHCDLSSDMTHDKDYYDGLCDVSHASDYITISNTYFHDHYKTSLVGHSDSNSDEDTGHLIVTYANNYWNGTNSRSPSFRFGTGHIFNSYYANVENGINTRMGAQLLVESCVFENCGTKGIYSADSDTVGYAVVNDVDLGVSENTADEGTLTSVDYEYTLLGSDSVATSVLENAGQTLSF